MVVKIRFIILIFFLFFSNYGFSAQNFQIIRDAEIEFFLHKVISSVIEDKKNKDYYPRLVLNNQYNAFVIGSNKIYVNTGLITKSKSLSEIQAIFAHEIGHLALNHYSSRLINAKSLNRYSKLATFAGLALSADGKLEIAIVAESGQSLAVSELDDLVLGLSVSGSSYNFRTFCPSDSAREDTARRSFNYESSLVATPTTARTWSCRPAFYVH